ncbi:MAG: hypothetical protein JNK33_02765 [Candidatus Doudnabacteria bacterium]|nr:hypothetical protein [Candidatus Doudnabacteria bacterium]
MSKEKQSKAVRQKQPKNLLVLVAILLIAVVVIAAFYSMQPKRSVAGYCKVYAEEKARLAKLPGDTYPSELFDDYLSDAGEIATSIERLEKSAPDDIRPDVTTLKSFYEKLDKEPSQLLSVSVAAQPVDKSVSNWTKDHCSN